MNALTVRLTALPLALSAFLFAGCIQASENAGGGAGSPRRRPDPAPQPGRPRRPGGTR